MREVFLRKIISGGQTGADQAGLWTAKSFGLATGGWAPEGFKTSEGPAPDLMARYGVKELPGSGYRKRTFRNVNDSDATIRLAADFGTPGEKCTLNAIKECGKPHFDVDLNTTYGRPKPNPKECAEWIIMGKFRTVNIAGNTQWTNGIDIFTKVRVYLGEVFRLMGFDPAV